MPIKNDSNEQVNNNNSEENLEGNSIDHSKSVTTSHPTMLIKFFILLHFYTNEISLLLPHHIIHDKIPALSSCNSYQSKKGGEEALKVCPLVNSILSPQHGEQLYPKNSIDEENQ